MKFAFMQNLLTQILFFAWIYNSFIISHLLEWLKVRQIKSGIRVNFDQCVWKPLKWKKMSFSLFNFYFCQQSSRMFGFDSEKDNFLCFSRITKHIEKLLMIHYYIIMNHQKFRKINSTKNDDFIDEGIANTVIQSNWMQL